MQDSFAHVDALKDFLQESAAWDAEDAAKATPGTSSSSSIMANAVHKALGELLREKAKSTDLELQVRLQ